MRHARHVDQLEPRRLLSADVVDGTLVVVGTNGPDRISMWEDIRDGGPVIIVYVDALLMGRPPEQYAIPREQLRSVLVRGLEGDDIIDLDIAPLGPTSGPLTLPARVDAGLGKDNVRGSLQRDFIYGGFGKDEINGSGGDDWIDGGWGDDRLDGGPGRDYVSGNFGNDFVYGGEGDDRLYGGPGNDHVGYNGVGPTVSEPGNDLLVGGTGEDWMVGGQGTDRIYGGAGRDHFSLEDGEPEKRDRTPDEPNDVPIFD